MNRIPITNDVISMNSRLIYFMTWTNRELEEISKGENIVKWKKEQKISWLGHLERMEEYRMHKKIFTQELEGTR